MLYKEPKKNAEPFAKFEMFEKQETFNSYVTVYSVTDLLTNKKIPGAASYSLRFMEKNAIAGLAFSSDSEWVEVSLDCNNNNPPKAWININDAKNENSHVRQWFEAFTEYESLQFSCDSSIAFYSEPELQKRIYPKILKYNDYSMRKLKTKESWMQVLLFSPSVFGRREDEIKKIIKSSTSCIKCWIKYLDKLGEPTIDALWE